MRFIETFQAGPFADTVVSLLAAFVLGTLIGAERQYRQRTAGLRTNVLVAWAPPPSSTWACASPAAPRRCG
jgi:putative Mg2+ transporter-C (MgtC) family protein